MKIKWQMALDLETRVQSIVFDQIEHGVAFDRDLAEQHLNTLDGFQNELYEKIRPMLDMELIIKEPVISEDKEINGIQFRKGERNYVKKLFLLNGNKTSSVVNHFGGNSDHINGPFSRIDWEEPTLSKRARLGKQLLRKGWKPEAYTDTGQPQLTVNGEPAPSLQRISGSLGKDLAKWFTYKHRASQITGLLGNVRPDGRIPSRINPLGTPTARGTHSVIANIPKAHPSVLFGAEMRELFTASKGYRLLGVDACGLEGRVAAHYTWPFDDGEFANELLNGDVHQKNADHFNIDRATAKTIFYGLCYGSGVGKVGQILDIKQKEAKKVYEEFWRANYSLGQVRKLCIKAQEERGWVKGIDGRKIFCRSSHSAMNSLFQSCGSILVKKAMVLFDDWIKERGLDVHQGCWYHDETFCDVREDLAIDGGEIMEKGKSVYTEAGEHFNMRIPFEGDARYGNNWKEIH